MKEIKFSKKQIGEFEKIGIMTIYLFGSQAAGKTHPLSDYDFGVVFEDPKEYKGETMDPYLKLYNIFTDILPSEYLKKRFRKKEHEFDIVFLQYAPISLQFEAIKNGKILYENSKEKRLNYEEYVMKRNCDLQHIKSIFNRANLERIGD